MLYVIVFAMIAAFLALRLYGVLGKRTGHEQQPLARTAEDRPAVAAVPRTIDVTPEPRELANRNIDPGPRPGCARSSPASRASTSASSWAGRAPPIA